MEATIFFAPRAEKKKKQKTKKKKNKKTKTKQNGTINTGLAS